MTSRYQEYEEEQRLWDELSHEQSREIAQHRAAASSSQSLLLGGGARNPPERRQRNVPPATAFGGVQFGRQMPPLPPPPGAGLIVPPGTRPGGGTGSNSSRALVHWPDVQRAADQTRSETYRLWGVIRDAISTSWRHHRQQQQQQQRSSDRYHPLAGQQPLESLDEFGIPRLGGSGAWGGDAGGGAGLPDVEDGGGGDGRGGGNLGGDDTPGSPEFVLLPRLSRGQTWGAAPNLDVYFSSLYSYYYNRGFVPIFAKGVVELTGLFFTLVLSVFLFAMVDWAALAGCIDESTCRARFSSYIHPNPFAPSRRSSWTFVVLGYALLFGAYGVFATWTFLHSLRRAGAAQWVFENQLGIGRRKLEGGAVDWDADVVSKLRELQRSGQYRVAIHQHSDHLDALVVANRIMRKENFLIAMLNCGVLDLTVPWFKDRTFFCSSIEWVLHFAVLNFLFNHKYQIRPAFYLDPASLRRRFIVCGIAHAVFLPFLLFFLTLHFGFQNAYDWKSTKRYLGPREWSLHARWLFREFNELPHHFERRIAPSYRATEDYFKLFGQSEATTAIGRVLVFVGGSLGAVLFLFAAINDAILLHVKIADWNLLWYAGVVGVVYSIGKSMLPADESTSAPRNVRNLFAEMDAALLNISKHTHYYLETWKGRGSDAATTSAISSMFKFKANLFAMEVASVIVAPYVLCVSLSRCAEGICEFVFSVKEEIVGAGEVCGFATFNFDKYSDEAWEGRTMGTTAMPSDPAPRISLSESILRTGNVERAAAYVRQPRTRHGKMEKSFFSFKTSHPGWQCSPSGQNLVDRVAQYEREETQTYSREQQLYIEAAARQLEFLTRLEQRQEIIAPTVRGLDESYIPKIAPATADAGAGLFAAAGNEAHSLTPKASPSRSHEAGPHYVQSPDDSTLPFAAPATSNQPDSPFALGQATTVAGPESRLHAAAGAHAVSPVVSSQLSRILSLSSLDPGLSSVLGMGYSVPGPAATGAVLGPLSFPLSELEDRRAERQYMWLERYHAHVAAQDRQLQRSAAGSSNDVPASVGPETQPEAGQSRCDGASPLLRSIV